MSGATSGGSVTKPFPLRLFDPIADLLDPGLGTDLVVSRARREAVVRQFLTLVRSWLTLRRDPIVQRQGPGTLLRDWRRAPAERAEHEAYRQHFARARRRITA